MNTENIAPLRAKSQNESDWTLPISSECFSAGPGYLHKIRSFSYIFYTERDSKVGVLARRLPRF
jgi:hypothetical protein